MIKYRVQQTEELVSPEVYDWRKIESNWEKYEEGATTQTGTETDVHAADYAELLKATCVYAIHCNLLVVA